MRFNLNTKSIRFRIWMYMLLFTAIIMLLMWFLQIFFLNNYYKDMKIDRTKDAAVQITSAYKSAGSEAAEQEATTLISGDDLFVVITHNSERTYPDNDDPAYTYELGEIETSMRNSAAGTTAFEGIIVNDTTKRETYYYAEILDKSSTDILPGKDETDVQNKKDQNTAQDTGTETLMNTSTVLYILSPLDPVSSTVYILQRQMVIIILISLITAFFISMFMTRRLSSPIVDITKSARKLADGQYGIKFPTDTTYEEITNLSETLNMMSTELERSALLQRDMLANVSHDLRTPLTMIQSYAEMIRDLSGDNPEKRNAHLDVIIDESNRLNTLVNEMLALSAMQAGTLPLDIRPFNIYDAVDSILGPYRVMEEKEGYSVIFNCKHDIYVEGDEERIKQVLSNLLSNAVKYCGLDKTVYINIRRWGTKVHFEVVDHGVGIKPDELAHIWDRYYMTSSNHVRPTKGSGLGLSIVKEILQLHDAKFGAESKVGKGTTMWFELKAAQPPEE